DGVRRCGGRASSSLASVWAILLGYSRSMQASASSAKRSVSIALALVRGEAAGVATAGRVHATSTSTTPTRRYTPRQYYGSPSGYAPHARVGAAHPRQLVPRAAHRRTRGRPLPRDLDRVRDARLRLGVGAAQAPARAAGRSAGGRPHQGHTREPRHGQAPG